MNKEFEKAENIICICVDEDCKGITKGKLYHCYSKTPIIFVEISDLLLAVDRLLDGINFPQASTKTRSFTKEDKIVNFGEELKKFMTPKEVAEQKGAKASFVVHVQYRQNSTWQGNVVWAEKNISKNFRSALELLKLIDGALDETGIPQE